MRLEVRFSLRIKAGDWRWSMLVRPWLKVDFDQLGEMFPRTKGALNYIRSRTQAGSSSARG